MSATASKLLATYEWDPGWKLTPRPVAAQIGVLGAIHMSNCGAAYLGIGTLARNTLTTRPSAAHAVTRAAGAAMIVLGTLLVMERAFASI